MLQIVEIFTAYHRLISTALHVFQRGPSDVSTHRSFQENEASQGLHILPRVDTRRTINRNRKQR